MNSAQILRLIPLVLLLLFSLVLSTGLLHPPATESKRVGKQLEAFNVPLINDPKIKMSQDSFKGQVVVINAFASWCKPCQEEHEVLMSLAKSGKVNVYGIAWRDKAENIVKFLNTHGNPFQMVGNDPDGRTTVPLSLTGVPETLVVDRDGIVKYRHVSALTLQDVNEQILPLIDTLNAEHVATH